MHRFGRRSLERLFTCDDRLQEIMTEAIKRSRIDMTILCGHRSKEDQDQAVNDGRSKVKYPNSKHNNSPSLAVDVAPYPIDWEDIKRFYYLAGIIEAVAFEKGIGIRWGGNWDSDAEFKDNKFNDLPHFELTNVDQERPEKVEKNIRADIVQDIKVKLQKLI